MRPSSSVQRRRPAQVSPYGIRNSARRLAQMAVVVDAGPGVVFNRRSDRWTDSAGPNVNCWTTLVREAA